MKHTLIETYLRTDTKKRNEHLAFWKGLQKPFQGFRNPTLTSESHFLQNKKMWGGRPTKITQ